MIGAVADAASAPPGDLPDAAFARLGDWSAPGPARAAVCLLFDAAGRVLLQLRDDAPGVAYPGTWSLFGGGVEDGETLRQAMVREIAEETGLILPESGLSPVARVISPLPSRRRIYGFEAAAPVDPAAIRLGEGAGFALFTPAQIAALVRPPHISLIIDHRLARR
jgi:8-oxo-dGTP diphosphatase